VTAVIRQYSQVMSQAGRPDEKVKVSDAPTAGTEAATLFAKILQISSSTPTTVTPR